ncbi:CCA tRNA nucleotidyltransferase [Bacillus sp. B1-b2]|nr:CCA tRNA nucleotidyltransferase [Bacillus sp. B1-b2]
MFKAFQDAIPMMKQIESAGYEAYFVGGSVRDYLLNKTINDIDIATSATPDEIKKIFPRTVDVGIEHGTIMVLWENNTYEVTTFRTESAYVDFRRPEQVFFVRQLKEDLKRRDFTINALAMDTSGHIYDYFKGKDSLALKEIKTVGHATERFQEDALRMMRGIRFISTLEFQLDKDTRASMEENNHLLLNIAVERISNEFEKLLMGNAVQDAIKDLIKTGIFSYLPGLAEQKSGLETFSTYNLSGLELGERWAILLLSINVVEKVEIDTMLRKWKLAVKQIKEIQKIIFWSKHREARLTWSNLDLYYATLGHALSAERIYQRRNHFESYREVDVLEKQYENLAIRRKEDLHITGSDLLQWSEKKPGPWLKQLLEQIETAVVNQQLVNEKQQIKEWLEKCHLI